MCVDVNEVDQLFRCQPMHIYEQIEEAACGPPLCECLAIMARGEAVGATMLPCSLLEQIHNRLIEAGVIKLSHHVRRHVTARDMQRDVHKSALDSDQLQQALKLLAELPTARFYEQSNVMVAESSVARQGDKTRYVACYAAAERTYTLSVLGSWGGG